MSARDHCGFSLKISPIVINQRKITRARPLGVRCDDNRRNTGNSLGISTCEAPHFCRVRRKGSPDDRNAYRWSFSGNFGWLVILPCVSNASWYNVCIWATLSVNPGEPPNHSGWGSSAAGWVWQLWLAIPKTCFCAFCAQTCSQESKHQGLIFHTLIGVSATT